MLYLLTTSFIAGVFLGNLLPLTLPTAALLFVSVGLFTIVVLIREPLVFKLSTCILLLFLGIWRYQLVQPKNISDWVQSLNDGPEITLVGQIVGDPERMGSVQRMEVGHLRLEDGRWKLDSDWILKGKILIKSRRYPEYHYGDEIKIAGKLQTPPEFEDFSYRNYLKTKGIYSLTDYPEITLLSSGNGSRTYAILLNFRHRVEERISQILPEPESSFLVGILLGVKRTLPEDFYDALQRSGTLHVVVVSGTNITYAISAFLGISGFLMLKPLRAAFAVFGILTYALMVGGEAAVWRATLMGLTVLLAAASGRRRLAQETLFLSAAILLMANPMGLWQIGFQLSFAATAGIIFLQDTLNQRLRVLPDKIREGLVTTLAAQITVLPIITYNFQTLSIVSPLANLLTFLLIPVLTVGGAVVALVALIWLPLSKLIAPLIYIPAKTFVTIVELSAEVPFAQVEMPRLPTFIWVIYYLTLITIVVANRDIQKQNG